MSSVLCCGLAQGPNRPHSGDCNRDRYDRIAASPSLYAREPSESLMFRPAIV